jgi:hypothetical protein
MQMPRPRPPHLHRQVTRHGRTVWYVRVGKGRRIRIRSEFGSAEFDAEYSAAIANSSRPSKAAPTAGSLAWLCERYRAECPKWANFKPATRKQRENIFQAVMEASGYVAARAIIRDHIEAGRDRRKPHQGRHFFEWATAVKLIQRDPTIGVTYPVAPRTKGFPEWTEEDVAKWEAAHPIGTPERVWLDVVLYTGARRGDAHRIGRQHLRPDGTLSFTTEKTDTPVTLPVLPALRRTIEAGPCSDLAFVCQRNGRPYSRKESFGNVFSDTARKLGIKKSLHGIRKIAAQRCAEAGASVHELNAIFGWTGTKMALRYTEAADRRRLAATGMAKLQAAEQNSNSIPSPGGANAPHPDFSTKQSKA